MKNKTVIISCAGMGTRLGMNTPKCLVDVGGKSLIEMQLNQLQDVDDIRVVVGFKKDEVIKKVKEINPNVKIYVNDNYKNTGTAGSFWSAIDGTEKDFVMAIDGDLIINPIDMAHLIESEEEFVCGEEKNTEDPVLVTLNGSNEVVKFSREEGTYEWAGVAQIRKENLIKGDRHIYQIIKPLLPLPFKLIRAKEIDTPSDLESAKEWIKNNNITSKDTMDNWFKSRFSIENNYEVSRHNINNRVDYDVELISRYTDINSSMLDLGCGTGVLEERLYKQLKYIKAIDKYQEFIARAIQANNVDYEKHDVVTYYEKRLYDLIAIFGVTVYLVDEEMQELLWNCGRMMNNDSTLIIKNQWSMLGQDKVVDKEYSDNNKNRYYGIYRTLDKMDDLLSDAGFNFDAVDLYPSDLNRYSDTHEYALICKKKIKRI